MRIRLRGPSGSTVTSIDEHATVAQLLELITEKTSLPKFDVKYGYPPKPLQLEAHEKTKKLSNIGIKLDGEQLIVSAADTGNSKAESQESSTTTRNSPPAKPSTLIASNTATSAPFSFADPDGSMSRVIEDGSVVPSQSKSNMPLSLNRKPNDLALDAPEVPLPSHGATLVLRVMPDDNSCLFRAIGSAVLGSIDSMTELRALVAGTIQDQPDLYTDAVLDQKPDEYCKWIQTEDAWGGGIVR